MTVPVDPIFPDQGESGEQPTTYIANPVRVQLPKYDARAEGRRWTQMDLVALANNILAREQECAELRKQVHAMGIQLVGVTRTLEELRSVVSNADGRYGGKLGRILSAIEKILDKDEDEYDGDRY